MIIWLPVGKMRVFVCLHVPSVRNTEKCSASPASLSSLYWLCCSQWQLTSFTSAQETAILCMGHSHLLWIFLVLVYVLPKQASSTASHPQPTEDQTMTHRSRRVPGFPLPRQKSGVICPTLGTGRWCTAWKLPELKTIIIIQIGTASPPLTVFVFMSC